MGEGLIAGIIEARRREIAAADARLLETFRDRAAERLAYQNRLTDFAEHVAHVRMARMRKHQRQKERARGR